jgi:hypothetical protein
MSEWFSLFLVLASGATPRVLPTQPHPMAGAAPAAVTLTATPGTISFTASNPSTAPSDAGNSAATVTWLYTGTRNYTWSLTVQASAAAFTNCATVPVSAVTVSCASATVGGGGAGTCGGAFPLSTASHVVVSGTEGRNSSTYTVVINFTLADSWKYIAKTSPACSLTLTYTTTLQ